MTELAAVFSELGISIYLHDFLEQGFDTWETILDITESDFDHLGVKLGHRRKIQRRIANSRGLSSDRALASPRHSPGAERPDEPRPVATRPDPRDAYIVNGNGNGNSNGNNNGPPLAAAPTGAKRKYRRHPKPDESAPERPPSAYVIFSNKMREELKGRNLSFTEIAKLVGENWQNLSPAEKEPYEQQAFGAKERYNSELAEYKKTEQYKEYSQYLVEFKSKHSNSQQGVPAETAVEADAVKRPKLETNHSATSSATSQQGSEGSNTRGRLDSTASTNGQWQPNEHSAQQVAIMPKLTMAHGGSNVQQSPTNMSPTVLPGYRDSISKPHQQLPWREAQRDEVVNQMTRSANFGEMHGSDIGNHQHSRRIDQNQPPPLLTSESTNSTASSTYFAPRTPLEPPLERALPIPSTFYQKNGFDNQLAPLRPPSLSPQASVASSQMSPNGHHTWTDFSHSMAPIRGYGPPQPVSADPDPRYRDAMSSTASVEDLDPISALLSLSKGR